jgi:hypothetical protein
MVETVGAHTNHCCVKKLQEDVSNVDFFQAVQFVETFTIGRL